MEQNLYSNKIYTSNITKSGAINTYNILSNKAGARSIFIYQIITFKYAMANKLCNPTYYVDLKCNIEQAISLFFVCL
ncbi:hypothetical protein pb186bvf_015940 [Paramecium bursaria]